MMKLKIGRVDMDGYCGRDNHPERRHEGLTVLVVGVETWWCSEDGDENINLTTTLFGESCRADLLRMLADSDHLDTVYTVYTEDGEKLEIMGHEVAEIIEGGRR